MASTRVVLEAGKTDREYLKDLWRYRELFYVLAWRDISVRYKQTAMGIAWAIIRPALSTIVLTLVFGRLGKFPSGGVPYPVLVLSGLLPWQLFSSSLAESGNSLIANSSLITKVYFPRLIVPGSAVVTSLVDFAISMVLLIGVMITYGVAPTWRVAFLPVFIALTMVTASGIGTWIAALNVRYRDFAFVVPFILQLGLYVSPVGFSTHLVPEQWRIFFSFNPMSAVIDGFRWALLPGPVAINGTSILICLMIVSIVTVTGFSYFRRTERSFADII